MHLEFVVLGSPVSNQSANLVSLRAWKASVRKEAQKRWKAAPLQGNLKAVIIHFHPQDKPLLDVDNMSKPIHDVMNSIVYGDDRQIRQAEIAHVRIDSPFIVAGASKLIVDALQKAQPFVYVRIEDAVEPFPLPK